MLFAIISGQMLGSVVSGFANVAFGWRSALFIASAVGAVAAIVAWTQMPATPRRGDAARRRRSPPLRPRLRQPEGAWLSAAVASRARSSTACSVHGRAPGRDHGARRHAISIETGSSSAPSASAACSTPPACACCCAARRAPDVPDRRGRRRRCYAALAFAPLWWLDAVAMFCAGIAFYMLHNSMQTEATELAPSARGSAVALFACGFFVGQGSGRRSSPRCCTASGRARRSSPSRSRSSSSATPS
jgi:MFS family permease